MQDDRPFGWRPFTDEHRAGLRESGFSEATIESMEADNIYSPIDYAIMAYELANATLSAAIKRFGADFAHDVRSELERRASTGEKSDVVEDNVDARIIRSFVEQRNWEALIAQASTGGA